VCSRPVRNRFQSGDAIGEIGYLAHIGVLFPALFQTLERAAVGYVSRSSWDLVGLAVVRVPCSRRDWILLAGLQASVSRLGADRAVFLAIGGQVEYAVYFVVIMVRSHRSPWIDVAYDNVPRSPSASRARWGARPGYYGTSLLGSAAGYVAG